MKKWFIERLRNFWYKNLADNLLPDKRSTVTQVNALAAVCFRHDMDNCGRKELEKFIEIQKTFGVPTSCYFLRYQIQEVLDLVDELKKDGHEIGLHSEARPFWGNSYVQLLWLVERAYRSKLSSQIKWMRKKGFESTGHSAHSINNYLGFQNWINWNVIEQASIGVGLKYISDWRTMAASSSGCTSFPEPLPPFTRTLKNGSILVLPTSWDDKFFFQSYEDRVIKKCFKPKTLQEALDSAKKQLDYCCEHNIPFILNLHPVNGIKRNFPIFELKLELIKLVRKKRLPIITINDLSDLILNKMLLY